jgi:murein DD-endopeptidase MepM/ murein hydrolase activator NlpD
MIENNERVRPSARDVSNNKNNQSEKGIFLSGIQIVVCLIIIAAAVVIKQVGGTVYAKVQPYVKEAVTTDINKEDVTSVFKNLGKQLPDAAQIFKNASSVPSSSSQSQASSAVVSDNSASSSIAVDSSSSGVSAASSQKAASDAVITEKTAKKVSTSGSFSKPNIIYASTAKTEEPPTTATYSPIKLSMLPIKPVEGKVTSVFGYRTNPVTGKYTFHTGMDIAAEKETAIKSCFDGTVEEAGNNETYGNYVLVDHQNGIKTFYADCDEITAMVGDKIKAGDTVAKVGSTGLFNRLSPSF